MKQNMMMNTMKVVDPPNEQDGNILIGNQVGLVHCGKRYLMMTSSDSMKRLKTSAFEYEEEEDSKRSSDVGIITNKFDYDQVLPHRAMSSASASAEVTAAVRNLYQKSHHHHHHHQQIYLKIILLQQDTTTTRLKVPMEFRVHVK
jgi:hypothetical protein